MIYRLLLTACSLPLVIYPGILMAGIMGLSSPPSPDATPLKILVAKGFLWSSILYPVGLRGGRCRERSVGCGRGRDCRRASVCMSGVVRGVVLAFCCEVSE